MVSAPEDGLSCLLQAFTSSTNIDLLWPTVSRVSWCVCERPFDSPSTASKGQGRI